MSNVFVSGGKMTEQELKLKVIDDLIDEYLKSTPSRKDLKVLMKKLEIDYSMDELVNMKEVFNSIELIEKPTSN